MKQEIPAIKILVQYGRMEYNHGSDSGRGEIPHRRYSPRTFGTIPKADPVKIRDRQ